MLVPKLTPRDVFTPRAQRVNGEMYVHRPELEQQIRNALSGHRHFLIHGESGNGKTWLYKKVFQDTRTDHTVINLALAANHKSIDRAISEKLAWIEPRRKTAEIVEKDMGFKPGGVGFAGKSTTTYQTAYSTPFLELLRRMAGTAKKNSIVVFDNFERITNKPDLVEELANYLILLDDDDYASFNVRVCIVGVPGNLKEYFSALPFSQTIATRLTEVREVERMTQEQGRELLCRGFKMLRLRHKRGESEDDHLQKLLFVADRAAVEIQDLGARVAEKAIKNEMVIEDLDIDDAISEWISSQHSKTCATIESLMSPAGLKNGRRNQILYCLGLIDTEEFDVVQLKNLIIMNFPRHCKWVEADFDRKFLPFIEGFDPLVRRGTQGNSFRISRSVYRIAIRALLKNDDDNGVHKVAKKL